MKTVYFVRHAKSSWDDMSLSDKDRPLNKRGFRDAPFMAEVLKGKGVKADAIVSSPANRAYTTATYFAKSLEIEVDNIIVKEQIYEAYIEEVLDVVKNLDESLTTVLVFGHNPTFTSLANRFSSDYIPNLPTCGIVKIESSSDLWTGFGRDNAKRTAFYYPKLYF